MKYGSDYKLKNNKNTKERSSSKKKNVKKRKNRTVMKVVVILLLLIIIALIALFGYRIYQTVEDFLELLLLFWEKIEKA